MVYFVFFITFLLLNWNYKNLSNKVRYLLRLFSVILFVIFLGFRYNVGKDYQNYVDYYSNIIYTNYLELGFDRLSILLKENNFDYVFMFAFMAGISCYFIFKRLFQLKDAFYFPSTLLIVIFGFIFLSNGVRQGVAVSIFFYSYRFIEEKKLLWFILSILLASFFHLSALYLIPFYFFARKDFGYKGFIFLIILLTLVLINIGYFSDKFDYFNYFNEYQERLKVTEKITVGTISLIIFNILIFLASFYRKIYRNNQVIFNFYFIYCVLLVFQGFVEIVGRFTIYFEWFSYLWVPIFLLSLRQYVERKSIIVIIYLFSLFYIVVAINAYSNFDEYSFYFLRD